jgi:hypothetical protein
LGIYAHQSPVFYLLTLKAGVMDQLFSDELDASLRLLDVTVLTRLVFMKILGFDQNRLDNEQLIGYASTAARLFNQSIPAPMMWHSSSIPPASNRFRRSPRKD